MSLTFADPLDTLAHRFTVSFIFAFYLFIRMDKIRYN
ncbi:hypothetical protein JQ038_11795 [Clostridium botulinum]|nr:hypothetical protein [Clostridium botulinum]